jgi:hypothetical protein
MTSQCPRCGAFVALVDVSDDASVAYSDGASRRISAQNGEVAQEILGSDLELSPNGARSYNQGYPHDFELWWKVFPIRKDKRKALKAWRNALRRAGASPEEAKAQLIAGAIRYRDDPNRSDEYSKYAEGWLNGDRWLDDPLPAREVRGQPEPPRRLTVAEEIERSRDA